MNVIKFLKDFTDLNPEKRPSVLARWIDENYPDFPFKTSTLERMMQRIRKNDDNFLRSKKEVDLDEFPLLNIDDIVIINEELSDIDVTVDEEAMKLEDTGTQYEYNEGIYVIGDSLKISGDLINKLFTDYPRKGLNLSRTALTNKYNLGSYGVDGPSVLRTIQHKLGLYKDSNIIAPHLYTELSTPELDDYIDSQLDSVINNPEYIEKKYNNRVLASYRTVINNDSLNKIDIYNKIEEISKQFEEVTKVVSIVKNKDITTKTCVVTIADMHSGASVKDVQRTHDFDTETIEKRLNKIAEVVNEGRYESVYIAIMGDVFQGTPFNHEGAGNTIAEQYAEQFKIAFNLLSDFLGKVANVKNIFAVGGNHDRASADNRKDQKSSILDILMFMLSKIIDIPIEFNHDTVSFIADGIHYILQHGHFNYHKKGAADIILDHGSIDKFNMIIRGHLHSLQVLNNDDRRNYRRVIVPSIYTGEDYSSTGGWSNNSGFVIFETDNNDKSSKLAPKMIVEALQ